MRPVVRIVADKVGVAGSLVSTMSCAMCFPAMASIGAAIGLGFLTRWESVFVHVLIPVFVLLALLANAAGWLSHRQWQRSLLGSIGPLVALVGWLAFIDAWLPTGGARGVLYTGLIIMLLAAIWDLVSPASRRCAVDGAGLAGKRG